VVPDAEAGPTGRVERDQGTSALAGDRTTVAADVLERLAG
jgi:hypothetical protein